MIDFVRTGAHPQLRNTHYFEIASCLSISSRSRHLVDPHKKFPFADIRLAALAFSLSDLRHSGAFASSDRELNSAVHDLSRSENEYYSGKVCPVSVYSFVQGASFFTPYMAEVSRINRKRKTGLYRKTLAD